MTDPLILWLIGDGKPGHENQSLGLAEAVMRRVPCEIHRISLAGQRGLFRRLSAGIKASASLPKPDFVIGAGHATHLALLRLAWKQRAKSVVLMRPSLPMSWFTLCIAPEHDFPKGAARKNLILTRGALNRVAPPTNENCGGKMILIGGPSASHGWDGAQLIEALSEITKSSIWQLTDSRRTPPGFIEEVHQRLPELEIFTHLETTPDWLPDKLATAAEVWVTEDSVSMIYEALSSGARVGLLPSPRNQSDSRVLRGLEGLISSGFITSFADWKKSKVLKPAPSILREADRCAQKLLLEN